VHQKGLGSFNAARACCKVNVLNVPAKKKRTRHRTRSPKQEARLRREARHREDQDARTEEAQGRCALI
jgi:hypothetical protein